MCWIEEAVNGTNKEEIINSNNNLKEMLLNILAYLYIMKLVGVF